MKFIPTHRAGIALSILIGILLGLGYYTWTYAEGGSYFSNDPKACAAPSSTFPVHVKRVILCRSRK